MKLFKKISILKIVLVIAFAHLGLVALGAFNLETPEGFWAPALDFYGELSGASSGYGFFAPGVHSQVRALFEITTQEGKTKLLLEDGVIHEVDLRVGDIVDQFGNEDTDDAMKFQRTLAASLAGAVFGRHPEASAVRISLERWDPVSMEDYRKGARSTWIPLYSAQFTKHQNIVRK